MELTGFLTQQGQSLTAGLLAGQTMTITKVTAGSGTASAASAVLPEEKQQLTLRPLDHDGETAHIPATLVAAQADAPYSLTELGVYASGENGTEVLYQVYRLSEPISICPDSTMTLRFLLRQTVANGVTLTTTVSPAGLVTVSEFDNALTQLQKAMYHSGGAILTSGNLRDYIRGLDHSALFGVTPNVTDGVPFPSYWLIEAKIYTPDKTWIEVTATRLIDLPGVRCHCIWNFSAWVQDWTYDNPPMDVGYEYRTSEFYGGKPVYQKIVDFGALPTYSKKEVQHNISNIQRVIFATISVNNSDWAIAYNSTSYLSDFQVNVNRVQITTNGSSLGSASTAWVLIRYIKTTD